MSKPKNRDVGKRRRLDMMATTLKEYEREGGNVIVNAVGANPTTNEPPMIVIHLPGVKHEDQKLVLVEDATNEKDVSDES